MTDDDIHVVKNLLDKKKQKYVDIESPNARKLLAKMNRASKKESVKDANNTSVQGKRK